jgi:UDP:flavonoid glycosyltransferase YjiC (YdhE family)
MTTAVIVAFGSRGDVAPFTGLGAQLRQAGHEVAIAALGPFENLVTEAGLEFRLLDVDPDAVPSAHAQSFVEDGGSLRKLAKIMPAVRELMGRVGPAVADAAKGADLLLTSVTSTHFGYHVAEAMGIPSAGLYVAPVEPTGDFPPLLADLRSFGRWGNRAMGRLAATQVQASYFKHINTLRRDMGLRPTTVRETLRRQREQRFTVLHGYSEHLAPRPADWRPGLELTGFWWPHRDPDWQPSRELQAFLDDGPPPVFVGFGSVTAARGSIAVEALRNAGVRGVLSGFEAEGDDMFTIGDTPFDWLFPRMAALVHHAGAGTTALGLRAGVPVVAVPGIADQFYWANRLAALGLTPDVMRQKQLDVDRLAKAIRRAIDDPSYRARTQEIGAAIAAEDSAQPVLDLVRELRP